MTDYVFFNTPFGTGGLIVDDDILARVYLPSGKKNSLEEKIKKDWPLAKLARSDETPAATKTARDLEQYFRGEDVDFSIGLDLSGLTDFERDIMRATRTIPFGECRSYGWVANAAGHGRADRAVGQVLGKNHWPVIIPCHRVVRSDGSLGGWSGEPGWKERLQQLEKSSYKKKPRIQDISLR